MGRELRELSVIGRVGRHNSPEDGQDDAAWEEFCAEVEKLQRDPRFARIFDHAVQPTNERETT